MENSINNAKPIFGIDVTLDKKNEKINGSEFITKSTSAKKFEEFEANQSTLEKTVEESKLPLWIRIVKTLCGFYGLLVLLGLVKALPDVGLKQALKNAPVLIFSGFAAIIVWAILQFAAKNKETAVLEEKNAEGQASKLDVSIQDIYDELEVPADAASVDVLTFRYVVKDGTIHPKSLPLQSTPYINLDLKAFADESFLHIVDLENVYSFSRTELRRIKTVNKRISVPFWNKKEQPQKGEFKPYKMTTNNMGDIFFKPYHILEIERDGQLFEIYFPCYELATFERLCELKAEKE